MPMTPAGKFAVVSPRAMLRGSPAIEATSPEDWMAVGIGRETAARVYEHAVPSSRYRDPYWGKHTVIARFDHQQEAIDLIMAARALFDVKSPAVRLAEDAVREARQVAHLARRARATAVAEFVVAERAKREI